MARTKTKRGESLDPLHLADVARDYFVNNQTQTQIAGRYGVTQSAVAQWLARARTLGIVSVDVDPEFAYSGTEEPALSRTLRDDFRLLDCVVVDPSPAADSDAKSDRLHTVLANTSGARLRDWIQSGDHIAVGGGRAPTKVARFIRRTAPPRRDIRITPLSGRIWTGSWQEDGPENLRRPLDADDAARLLALAYEHEPGTRFSQIGHPLYADDVSVAEVMIENECMFSSGGSWKTEGGFQPPVRALVGVGVLDPSSGHRISELLASRPRQRLAPRHLEWAARKFKTAIEFTKNKGLHYFGDVANRLFVSLPLPRELRNRALPPPGVYPMLQKLLDELNERAIVMEWEHLRRIPYVWAIAGGAAKSAVLWTLLLSRHLETDKGKTLIKELTVDVATARKLHDALQDFENAPAKVRDWYAQICSRIFA